MNPEIVEIVLKKIQQIEQEHNVTILYAVESGSRAWGFESVDSDYDVRFIYAHPLKWYLNILPQCDVIEYPIIDEFDYSGWDLRKTLYLMNKSNPVLFEWLKSPIIYHKNAYFYEVMEQLAKTYFSPISSVYHYLHMAKGNYRQYLQSDEVRIKKYFYVLRPILSCMWIENYTETPPLEFEKLLVLLTDKVLLKEISDLLAKKKAGVELGIEPKNQILCTFIEEMIAHFDIVSKTFDPRKKPHQNLLKEGFVDILEHIGG